ncbi:MAG: nucleotide sugar dehydrogenase [Bacteroidales bacterium]|nr:nucleotide sugar dehydrogenase [Bacteroidales bacterium]
METNDNIIVGIIGLGYVGLPLALLFSERYKTIGFDTDCFKIKQLNDLHDQMGEFSSEELACAFNSGFICSDQTEVLRKCNVYIITVPTPVDNNKKPQFDCLINACKIIAEYIENGNVVILESTVYPGVTEDICGSIFGAKGLELNIDYYLGYSPERINPGDKVHTIRNIRKIVSGSNDKVAKFIADLYGSVISAGIYVAPDIKTAEAAKVIENTQRDINIAFVNELSKIFSAKSIDTYEVLKAASTKWNFLNFKPGLVGGHCIGVDPYYLAEFAIKNKYYPEIILAGRNVNESMSQYIVNRLIKELICKSIDVPHSKILVAGLTFKEGCRDIRNSKAADLYYLLREYNIQVDVYEPHAECSDIIKTYDIIPVQSLNGLKYDAIIIAVAHKDFCNIDWSLHLNPKSIIFDVKNILTNSYNNKITL